MNSILGQSYILNELTNFLDPKSIMEMSNVCRATRAHFKQNNLAWVAHAEKLGLPRGERTLQGMKKLVNNTANFLRDEIEYFTGGTCPYPEEANELVGEMINYAHLGKIQRVLEDHLYARVICYLVKAKKLERSPPINHFPRTLEELHNVSMERSLLTDVSKHRPVAVRVDQTELQKYKTFLGETHRICTSSQIRLLNVVNDFRHLPEEFFALDTDVISIIGDIEALPELTKDYPHIIQLFLSGCTIDSLPRSIERLTNLRWISFTNCLFDQMPKELLLLPALQEVQIGEFVDCEASAKVVQELKAKGVSVTYVETDE